VLLASVVTANSGNWLSTLLLTVPPCASGSGETAVM
jgi:hypothetical protein